MSHDAENFLLTYQSAQDYLKLSRVYAEYLGGLRWSGQEDALVDADNRTFAFSEATAEFIEGFASQGRVVAFGYLLHWMDLLQNQRRLTTPAIQRLQRIFAEAGSNWRFAGAFAATLSEDVPELADPPDLATVGKRLRNRAFPIRWFTSQFHELQYPPEHPPIAPPALEENVIRKLEGYSEADLRAWLQTGRGPIKHAERLAQEPPMPRSLARVLASLVERPRMAGAHTYVTQLVGALTLPPRRFVPQELPVGGYTDIVTRGLIEHLLPTQFALDELEFLRRFAQKELLYFRREEPPAQNRQELVVLLDQGVRTWGDVRLVLAAAALAFGKQAILRKTPLFLATTSNGGVIVDPTQEDQESLGQYFESSDLSLNPGLALEHVLEVASEALRDVVLLTHRRSLREDDVLNAARRLGPRDRLFAVALDGHGHVEVSEIRRGTPIKVRQFHVEFAASHPKPGRHHSSSIAPGAPWTGDVEAIPFPFRLGTQPHVTHLDFDYAGKWLLTVSGQGILHLWNLDRTGQEMLPRPCRGTVMKNVIGILGVTGGFVVIGRHEARLAVVHYDVVRRHCKWFDLGPSDLDRVHRTYVAEHHSVVIFSLPVYPAHVVELDCQAVFTTGSGNPPARAALSLAQARSGKVLLDNRCLPCFSSDAVFDGNTQLWRTSACHVQSTTGIVIVRCPNMCWGPYSPCTEGKPTFRGTILQETQLAGNTLAVRGRREDIGDSITLVNGPDGAILREYRIVRPKHKIARHLLSFDGSRIALLRSDHRVEVDPVLDRSLPSLCTRVGGFTAEAGLAVGRHCVMVYMGASKQFRHLFDWSSGTLKHHYERSPLKMHGPEYAPITRAGSPFFALPPLTPGQALPLPACCMADRERYVAAVKRDLWFVLDRFGQVAVLDESEQVLAMFIAFRDRHAAWMPDGTRFGSLTLGLGAATPGAAEKIGQALLRAQEGWKLSEGVLPAQSINETAPCPYCGEGLRTPRAKQCRFCMMDWHDPDNVYRSERKAK